MPTTKSTLGSPLGIVSSNAFDRNPVNKKERMLMKAAKIDGPNAIRKSPRLTRKIQQEFKLKKMQKEARKVEDERIRRLENQMNDVMRARETPVRSGKTYG